MQIILQSAAIFNFLGSLQQRAPAALAITDALVHDVPMDPKWPDTQAMPGMLAKQMREIERFAQSLPELQSEVCRASSAFVRLFLSPTCIALVLRLAWMLHVLPTGSLS